MKKNRQEIIIRIINENEIQTQEELISKLKSEGINATQATVSRDIRDLKLEKIRVGSGMKYALPQRSEIVIGAKYRNILKETVVTVESTSVFAVLKTYSGMANAAAAAIDSLNLSDILGTIAGDDTILVIFRTEGEAVQFAEKLRQVTKEN